jgi:MFS family permease
MPQSHFEKNLRIFAAIVALQYLAAPVIYVGITQASLLKQLDANALVANLPGASFFVMATLVALIAWAFPKVRHLKPILMSCYGLAAITSGLTAVALILPVSNQVKIVAVILQSGITGATIPTAIAFIWEVLGRTTNESKRGVALGLAYGAGPVLAAVGSLASQLILAGHFELGPLNLQSETLDSPWNYALLFALIAPVMGLASYLASRFEIVVPEEEPSRRPFTAVIDLSLGIAAGVAAMVFALYENMSISIICMLISTGLFIVHFRDLLSIRVLRLVAFMTVIFYIGNTIPSNMSLYSSSVLGVDPVEYAGYQNLLRFSFKALAGAALGWLLVKTNPRAGVLVTAGLYVFALAWAIFATGKAYLLAFGIFGAGELIGVYAPNYMLSACRKSEMKRGQVMMNLAMGPVGQAGVLFGWIVDTVHENDLTAFGQDSRALGFKVSFTICAGIILLGMLFTLLWIPANPQRENADSKLDG